MNKRDRDAHVCTVLRRYLDGNLDEPMTDDEERACSAYVLDLSVSTDTASRVAHVMRELDSARVQREHEDRQRA